MSLITFSLGLIGMVSSSGVKRMLRDGEFKWGKEDASHLIVSSIDTIRGLDEDMWSDLRAVLLERYKGK